MSNPHLKNRSFENKKSEARVQAVSSWKAGLSISHIAKNIGKSRPTVYRWIESAKNNLGKNKSRVHKKIDLHTKFRIIELFILLKKPSIRELKEHLKSLYHIQMTDIQIRYALKKWGVFDFQPSPFFDAILRDRVNQMDQKNRNQEKLSGEKRLERKRIEENAEINASV